MKNTDPRGPWSQPPETLDLHPGQVDVWRLSLDLPPAAVKRLKAALSEEETQRAARFRFPADRDRYIAAHGGLRDILARYLHRSPGQILFSKNEYGKPALQDHELEFNLSHSGDFALVAVTRGHTIGADVERFRTDLDFERLAGRFFSHSEAAELATFSSEERRAAFFRCWTRKEAYIKAQGLGLSLPLKDFDVSLGDPAILCATRPDSIEAARWTLFSLEVDPGYAGAVAVANTALSPPVPDRGTKGEGLQLRLWDWNTQERIERIQTTQENSQRG